MRTRKVMRPNRLVLAALVALATVALTTLSAGLALAASAGEIDRNANRALVFAL